MKAILHADKNWGIGKNNSLMFRIPADMKFFKETTTGNTVVMGSNTLKSLPQGKPLKDRINIVLYPEGEDREDCKIVHSLNELFTEIKKYPPECVFVIGGQMMFKTLLPYCDEVFVTKVEAEGEADAFFENLDKNENFKLVHESEPIETNGYTIKFTTYKNLSVKPI
ncbi:MAG: dihydrofolate reductase [Clostridiales bacterium]|nr:dihydrofolate reductase [Clostridiales bacterium]